MGTKLYRYLVCGFLLIFFAACAPNIPVVSTMTPSPSAVSTSNAIPVSFPSQTTSSVPTATPPLHFFFPKIEKLCPEKREVSIDKIGIDGSIKVILSDSKQTGLWSLGAENLLPHLIQKLPLDKWTSYSINPDGIMLAYTIWNSDNSSSAWVYDLENMTQREVLNIKYWEGLAPYVRWLSQNELLIINSSAGIGGTSPIEIVDVDTGKSLDVNRVDSTPLEYLGSYLNNGTYLGLYSSLDDIDTSYTKFYLYDYFSNKKTLAFPWLQDRIFYYPYGGTNLQIEFDLNKVAMIVEQSYGFDVGIIDKSIEMLTQPKPYNVVMKRLFANTGSNFDRLRYSLIGLNSATNTVFLSMSYRDYIDTTNNIADFKVSDIEDAFFSLDFQKIVSAAPVDYLVFKDYCFTTTEYFMRGVSSDGQVAAFSSDKELILMNLETGYLTRLPNWQFIGWAK
jgi:hypothetical protein